MSRVTTDPKDLLRLCAFTFFMSFTFLLGSELYHLKVRYDNLEEQMYQQQKSVEEVIRDLKKQLSHTQFFRQETECLAKNIFFEAYNQDTVGMLAVASVTMNRVHSSKFPKTVCGVVLQRSKKGCQFSWVCDDRSDIITNRTAYYRVVNMAKQILLNRNNSLLPRNTLYYHAAQVTPDWAKTKKFFRKIGNHLFYREAS